MAATPPVERVPSPSLFNSFRSFWAAILATLCTRFDLATVELEEQAIFAAQLVVAGLVCLLCLATAFLFLMVLIVVIFWAENILVLSLILGVYLLGALISGGMAYSMAMHRPKLLEQTLIELRKDAEGLRKPILHTTGEHK
jgi:uncharacterized membrane protein YqjE